MSKYEEIAERLKREILAGMASPLPSERELALRFDVSYITMRRAIGELVSRGMLSREHGRGIFVKTPERDGEKTMGLGFVTPERIWTREHVLSQYYSEVYCSAVWEAQQFGYHLVMAFRPEDLMSLEGRRKVDAVLAVCPDDMSVFKNIARFLPVIVLGHNYPESPYPAVFIDDFAAAGKIVSYLISTGHRRIAHLYGNDEVWSFNQRRRGYRQALADAGIPFDPELEITTNDFQLLSSKLISGTDPVTAFFCHNDGTAYNLLNFLHESGIRVPETVSVVGFDDLSGSAVWCPPLTTVNNPKVELGQCGIRMAVELLRHELPPKDYRQELTCNLMIRKTTARKN